MYISTFAIQQTLDAQLQTVSGLPTFYQENFTAVSTNINPFCRSTLGPAKTTIESLGSNPILLQTGLYQVDLFFPSGYGFGAGRAMADLAVNAFPPGFLPLPDGQHQLIILTAWSQTGLGYTDEGDFWGIPVRVEWQIRA